MYSNLTKSPRHTSNVIHFYFCHHYLLARPPTSPRKKKQIVTTSSHPILESPQRLNDQRSQPLSWVSSMRARPSAIRNAIVILRNHGGLRQLNALYYYTGKEFSCKLSHQKPSPPPQDSAGLPPKLDNTLPFPFLNLVDLGLGLNKFTIAVLKLLVWRWNRFLVGDALPDTLPSVCSSPPSQPSVAGEPILRSEMGPTWFHIALRIWCSSEMGCSSDMKSACEEEKEAVEGVQRLTPRPWLVG